MVIRTLRCPPHTWDWSTSNAGNSIKRSSNWNDPRRFLAAPAVTPRCRGVGAAEATARKAVAVQSQLPADNIERAVGLTFLGFVLMKQHQLVEARQVLERALELRRPAFTPPNWRIAETAGWLGETLALQGARDRARPLLEESLSTFTTLYGDANPRTTDARLRIERAVDAIRRGALGEPVRRHEDRSVPQPPARSGARASAIQRSAATGPPPHGRRASH